MLLDEILVNLNESAEAEHPENCDCPECKAKRAEECEGEECMEECSEAHDFWKETGIEESEDKELSNLNDKMRKLMKKRSECASGSAKQEKINDQLDKIYDRRHELMSKKTLNEDGEGSKVLEALEDINSESELNEKNFNCQKAEYGLKSGKFICDGKDLTDELHGTADKAGKTAANATEVDEAQELYDEISEGLFSGAVKAVYDIGHESVKNAEKQHHEAKAAAKGAKPVESKEAKPVTEGLGTSLKNIAKAGKEFGKQAAETAKGVADAVKQSGETLGKSVTECSTKLDEYEGTTKNNAEAGANIGADLGRWVGKGLDKLKDYGKQAADYAGREFNKAREALYKDTAGLREEDEENPWAPENQDPEKRYMLDAVTSAPETVEYPDKVDEDAWDDEAIESAKKMDKEGCADCTTVDGRDDLTPFKESMYRVSKTDGSNEYIMAESTEKFAEYINESFEDIVSFEKINTEALNESMDHEIVDTVVAELSKSDKVSLSDIQSMLGDMVDDSMSEEFIKTIINKIVNRLSDTGIEVAE